MLIISELEPDRYQKPPFPFYVEEFTGGQPARSAEELQLVESIFATTTDRAIDRTPHDQVERHGEDRWLDGTTSESVDTPTADGMPASVTIQRDRSGTVIRRAVTLYWDDDLTGNSTYEISYRENAPAVCREDDSGHMAAGVSHHGEAHLSAIEAMTTQERERLNNQPIGEREARGLQGYLSTTPATAS